MGEKNQRKLDKNKNIIIPGFKGLFTPFCVKIEKVPEISDGVGEDGSGVLITP